LSTLAATNNYVEKILTSMAEVLLVTTASGKIKKVNQAAQDLFGYSESELVGQQIDVLATVGASLQGVSQYPPQQSQINTEVICRAKSGEKLTVSFSCTAISTEIQGISGSGTAVQDFVYIGRDVTDRQRARRRKITQYVTTGIL
jgi:PAS domain S-box-containing protein